MAIVDVKNYSIAFADKVVHRDVSFSLREGECLGLIGGSGVGKSVILKSLIGLVKPTAGHITVDGHEVNGMNEDELIEVRKKVAYVFQNGALFDSLTVFDNLAYPLREHTDLSEVQIKHQVLSLLDEFGLLGNEYIFPAELSGGMQKRVGLARSIILHPKVVLYDEPTAGLDPYNTKKIQEMILNLKAKQVSSIFVTHDMPSAYAVCDRFVFLQGGVVKAKASIEEVQLKKNPIIQSFVDGTSRE